MRLKFRDFFMACYITMALAGAFLALMELHRYGTMSGHSLVVPLIAFTMWVIDECIPRKRKPIVHTVQRMVIIEKKGAGWSEDD